MSEVAQLELAFRLLVAGISILGPTVLFLGLWRFLEWLRDDELVEHLAARGVLDHPEVEVTTEEVLETVAGSGSAPRRCARCGARNAAGASDCRNCSASLE